MEKTLSIPFIILVGLVLQIQCLTLPVIGVASVVADESSSSQQRSPRNGNPQISLQSPIDGVDNAPSSSISGPVIPFNFPDPGILRYDNITYAFATNNRVESPSSHVHVQVATKSADSDSSWTLHPDHDALPNPGPWAVSPGVWAPDVISLPSGTFVLYYAAIHKDHRDTHCIGAAVSPPSAPLGPYTPLATPLACPTYLGGAIDPDGFLDPITSRRYVLYKIDGNNVGHGGLCRNSIPPLLPTPILLQEVSARDGVTPIGSPVELLDRTDDDGPLIEAPSLYRSKEGIYFLFYSSNCFTTPGYDIRYATATDIKGPYTRADQPLLRSGEYLSGGVQIKLTGPGGMDILSSPSFSATTTLTTTTNSADAAEESTDILFHAILSEADMPDDYRRSQKSSHPARFAAIDNDHHHHHYNHKDEINNDDVKIQSLPESDASQDGIPQRPSGIIRGMYTAQVRFRGRTVEIV